MSSRPGGPVWLSLVAMAALTALASGCSLLVKPDHDIRCSSPDGGASPCPPGMTCQGGFCVGTTDAGPPTDGGFLDVPRPDGCTPGAMELCNGVDDNCDGVIDEGHDIDGDGLTWCGGGVREFVDCDDMDPMVHPAGPGGVPPAVNELCDGKDNNCDGIVDNEHAGPICPSGQICSPTDGCVVPDCTMPGYECSADERCDISRTPAACVPGGCLSTGCTPPQECDPDTRSCVERMPSGSACSADAECESRVCASRDAAGVGSAPARFCTRGCCTDADCSGADICWASGTGAKLCVPASWVERTRGGGNAGDSCSGGDSCQSGICLTSSGCLGNCAQDGDCSQVCGVVGYRQAGGSDVTQLACTSSAGSGRYGDVDFDCRSLECRSGACLRVGAIGAVCTAACRSGASDCPDVTVPLIGTLRFYCGYAQASTGDWVQVCVQDNHGGGRTGMACGGNGDCRDGTCIDGVCADTCCSDAQCSGDTHCRPVRRSGSFEMHCVH